MGGGRGGFSTACAAQCTTADGGPGGTQLCASSTECPAGDTCVMFGGGAGVCRTPRGDGGFQRDGSAPPADGAAD
jgi:hypothetical protein